MVRADEPLEEGTPLNKATLLDNETAASLGLTEDSNVTDALKTLSLNKVNKSDIIDNLITSEAKKPLSANQGMILNGLVNGARESITDINNKLVKIYIGQYEGTGTDTLELVLPYKPKAILMIGGANNDSYKRTVFAIIDLSKTGSIAKRTPVVYYSNDEDVGTIHYIDVSFNEENNTLTISRNGGATFVFNHDNETQTYIMFG